MREKQKGFNKGQHRGKRIESNQERDRERTYKGKRDEVDEKHKLLKERSVCEIEVEVKRENMFV